VIIQLDLKPFVPQASALLWVEQELWVEQALWIEVSQLLLSDETFLALYEFQPPSFDPPPSLHVLSLLLLSAEPLQNGGFLGLVLELKLWMPPLSLVPVSPISDPHLLISQNIDMTCSWKTIKIPDKIVQATASNISHSL
jgi:hypothetical protein